MNNTAQTYALSIAVVAVEAQKNWQKPEKKPKCLHKAYTTNTYIYPMM